MNRRVALSPLASPYLGGDGINCIQIMIPTSTEMGRNHEYCLAKIEGCPDMLLISE